MRKTGTSKALLATGTMMTALLGGVVTAAPAHAADGVCTGVFVAHDRSAGLHLVYPKNVAHNSLDCYLKYGHTGAGVRALQKNMNSCYGKRLELDGIFGSATRSALRNVQERIGAKVDGVYGSETLGEMKWARYRNETGARYDCV